MNPSRALQAGATFALFAGFALFLLAGGDEPAVGHYARAFAAARSALVDWLGADGAALASVAAGAILAALVYFGPSRER